MLCTSLTECVLALRSGGKDQVSEREEEPVDRVFREDDVHDDEVDGRGEEASEAVLVRSILHRARLLEATSATEKSLAEVHRYIW